MADVRNTDQGPRSTPPGSLCAARDRKGASPRQARLIDWLKHPTGLPDHPAIRVENAMWMAREIVELSGFYESRRACLDDLNTLRQADVVERFGNRWRYLPAGRPR